MSKMLLLLDVDGVLNPLASRNWLDKSNFRKRNTTIANGNTYPVWLNRDHGQMLLDIAKQYDMELVWCTTWEHEANEFIGWRIGLPKLPVIEFGFNAARWKFNAVLEYAQDRPLAWLDDDFTLQHDHRDWFMDQRAPIPTILQQVSATTGFTQDDLDAIGAWANEIS
jgi:hypothetical protein